MWLSFQALDRTCCNQWDFLLQDQVTRGIRWQWLIHSSKFLFLSPLLCHHTTIFFCMMCTVLYFTVTVAVFIARKLTMCHSPHALLPPSNPHLHFQLNIFGATVCWLKYALFKNHLKNMPIIKWTNNVLFLGFNLLCVNEDEPKK